MTIVDAPPRSAEEPEPHLPPATGILAWLTTTDHKRIGVSYMVTAFGFFLLGGLLALVMRAELYETGLQVVSENRYSELFTMHGSIMMFLFLGPFAFGFANYIVPLHIGAPDMAFPRLNALSYWLYLGGGLTMVAGFLTAEGAADFGWTGYPPLSLEKYSPTIGGELWLIGVLLTGFSSVFTGVNVITTVVGLRAPGMRMFRLPIFTWNMVVTSVLVLMAFPVLTAAGVLLFAERHFDFVVFDAAEGGSPILWQHLFWFFGHPEVYILALPFFGVVTEVIATFSRRPVFGYKGMVFATLLIAGLSMSVWAHHMFATGAVLLPFFGGMSMLIAVPTGVKIFNWIGTMWGGRIAFKTSMLFAVAFIVTFVLGGISGVQLASPPLDFQVHDTYFVVAHMHYVLFGGSVFGIFAGLYYWFPKMSGRMLSESLGKLSFWLMFIGFNTTFLIQHSAGLSGMPRRVYDYDDSLGVTAYNLISTIGAFILALGVLVTLINVVHSIRNGKRAGNDPWQGNTLEWFTTSPPPPNNFDTIPRVRSVEPMKDIRREVLARSRPTETVAQPAAPRSL